MAGWPNGLVTVIGGILALLSFYLRSLRKTLIGQPTDRGSAGARSIGATLWAMAVVMLTLAALLCGLAGALMWSFHRRQAVAWYVCGGFALALAQSEAAHLGFRVVQKFRAAAWRVGLWDDRRQAQEPLIVLVLAAAALLALAAFVLLRRWPMSLRIAVAACTYLLAVTVVRDISLHRVDEILFEPMGPTYLAGLLQAFGAGLLALAASLTALRLKRAGARPPRRRG